jgi:hypothetical protein
MIETPVVLTITEGVTGRRRRLRIESRADGEGYWLVEQERRGCRWHPVGREPLSAAALDRPD